MRSPFLHLHFTTLHSTNDWAKEHLDRCALDGLTLVSADSQTRGRGRYNRAWSSPPGVNLYATYIFFVDPQQFDPATFVQSMAEAVCEILKTKGMEPVIKWPNDVLVGGKKIAGILCETLPHAAKLAIVTGVGLNVNMPLTALLEIDQPATSILQETKTTTSIEMWIELLTQAFAKKIETS